MRPISQRRLNGVEHLTLKIPTVLAILYYGIAYNIVMYNNAAVGAGFETRAENRSTYILKKKKKKNANVTCNIKDIV